MNESPTPPAQPATPAKVRGRPWPKGVSGNPLGRPKIEPRIRKHARRYDMAVIAELWKIATDPKVDPDVRRRCLMDLQSIGNGRPPTTQELVGRPDAPLVSVNVNQPGPVITSALDLEAFYGRFMSGQLDPATARFPPLPPPVAGANGHAIESAAGFDTSAHVDLVDAEVAQ